MIQFQTKHQKYLNGLIKLYNNLKEGIQYSPTQMAEDYRLNSYFVTYLLQEKIVLRKRNGRNFTYTWNSIRPNQQMVAKLMELCRQKSNEFNKNRQPLKPNKTTSKQKIPSPVYSEETKKTLEFLLEVYFKCKNKEEGFVRPLINSYGIHKNASQVLMHYEYVKRKDGTHEYEWLKVMPNYEMAKQFELDVKDFRKQQGRKYTEKKQEKPKITTITKSYFFGLFKTTKQTQ